MNNKDAKTRSELKLAKVLPTLLILGVLAVFLLIGLFCGGCTVSRMKANDATLTTYTVAWPWLDTQKGLEKARLQTKTNAAEITLSGYSESETVSTNAVSFMERGISAAVGTAIDKAKGVK